MATDILGLLPGCELVRLGQCGPEEFEQHGEALYKGARFGSHVVVRPAAGWEFRFDIENNCYAPSKLLPSPRVFCVRVSARNEADVEAISRFKDNPRFLSITEEELPADPAPPAAEQVDV